MTFAITQTKAFQNIGPFQMPEFSNNKVASKARVGTNAVQFGGSVSTTAPVVNSMFLKNITPQVGKAQNRLNIMA